MMPSTAVSSTAWRRMPWWTCSSLDGLRRVLTFAEGTCPPLCAANSGVNYSARIGINTRGVTSRCHESDNRVRFGSPKWSELAPEVGWDRLTGDHRGGFVEADDLLPVLGAKPAQRDRALLRLALADHEQQRDLRQRMLADLVVDGLVA